MENSGAALTRAAKRARLLLKMELSSLSFVKERLSVKFQSWSNLTLTKRLLLVID